MHEASYAKCGSSIDAVLDACVVQRLREDLFDEPFQSRQSACEITGEGAIPSFLCPKPLYMNPTFPEG